MSTPPHPQPPPPPPPRHTPATLSPRIVPAAPSCRFRALPAHWTYSPLLTTSSPVHTAVSEPFCTSAKKTTKMLIRHNLDGVMVDYFASYTLRFFSLAVAAIVGCLAYYGQRPTPTQHTTQHAQQPRTAGLSTRPAAAAMNCRRCHCRCFDTVTALTAATAGTGIPLLAKTITAGGEIGEMLGVLAALVTYCVLAMVAGILLIIVNTIYVCYMLDLDHAYAPSGKPTPRTQQTALRIVLRFHDSAFASQQPRWHSRGAVA